MITNHPSPTLLHQSLADIVTADTRTAAVFDRFGLDYCCRGHQTIEEAASERSLPIAGVLAALEALGPKAAADRGPAEDGDIGALARHIVTTHHEYVRRSGPMIAQWLDKLERVHGARHPELRQVHAVFLELDEELTTHMMKEENILFPYIDALTSASRTGSRLPPGPFGTVLNPIRVMEEDHRHAGDALVRLRQLTDGFQPPADACTTYRACYDELLRYEADLHRHVHLENHVLFPRALALEHELS